jgi:hypothetical protein
MTWILAVVLLAFLVIPRLLRRRRGIVTVFPSQPISTLHTTMLRKTKKETKAALDAATMLLK